MRWWKTGCLLLTRACTNQTPQIYFYGNDDPLARLDLLDSYLDEFEAIKAIAIAAREEADALKARLDALEAASKA